MREGAAERAVRDRNRVEPLCLCDPEPPQLGRRPFEAVQARLEVDHDDGCEAIDTSRAAGLSPYLLRERDTCDEPL